MAELHFLRPWWLVSLPVAVAIWWGHLRRESARDTLGALVDPHLLPHLVVGGGGRRLLRPVHVSLAVWVVAALAVAGPAWYREPSPFADDQAGLMVVLRAGQTMDATDLQPSRLRRAQFKLRDLLTAREGAANGLIVYSGSAHLVMPLTRDGRMLAELADAVSTDIMPVDGDALTAAVVLADTMLQRAKVGGSVLVMTDGVSPAAARDLADVAPGLPVQFLALQSARSPLDPGLKRAASGRGTGVVTLTLNDDDIALIARRAAADFQAAPAPSGRRRWAEAGYWLGPVLLLLTVAWSRRGWLLT